MVPPISLSRYPALTMQTSFVGQQLVARTKAAKVSRGWREELQLSCPVLSSPVPSQTAVNTKTVAAKAAPKKAVVDSDSGAAQYVRPAEEPTATSLSHALGLAGAPPARACHPLHAPHGTALRRRGPGDGDACRSGAEGIIAADMVASLACSCYTDHRRSRCSVALAPLR